MSERESNQELVAFQEKIIDVLKKNATHFDANFTEVAKELTEIDMRLWNEFTELLEDVATDPQFDAATYLPKVAQLEHAFKGVKKHVHHQGRSDFFAFFANMIGVLNVNLQFLAHSSVPKAKIEAMDELKNLKKQCDK